MWFQVRVRVSIRFRLRFGLDTARIGSLLFRKPAADTVYTAKIPPVKLQIKSFENIICGELCLQAISDTYTAHM